MFTDIFFRREFCFYDCCNAPMCMFVIGALEVYYDDDDDDDGDQPGIETSHPSTR